MKKCFVLQKANLFTSKRFFKINFSHTIEKMSLGLNSNFMLNTLTTSSALLGNSLNGLNNLSAGLGLGLNSLSGLNSQALAGLGFGLNGIGTTRLGLLADQNTFLRDPAYFFNLGLCRHCTTQCPSGTSCNNGVCRAFKLQGYIPNPNRTRIYRECDRSNYYHSHGRGRKHH